jgi:diacylglycerol kinase (ATP)
MDNPNKYQKYNLFKSFKYAIRGGIHGVFTEPSAKIQFALGLFLVLINLMRMDFSFAFLHLIFGLFTISQEIMNTAVEYLCDMITMEYSEKVKRVKDLAAGSVLLMSIAWGCIILVNILVAIWSLY